MVLDFKILGELEVLRDGDPVELGSPRQKALLARLLISSGETVSTDRLVEDLWRGNVPETARHTLHVYVSRIRKALGDNRTKLLRQGNGYVLSIEPAELDASQFEQLAAEGRAALARHDADMASRHLHEALSVWRGTALAEFSDETFARDEAVRLDELRLATIEQRMWADLELARHGEVVEELQELVTRHPFRETLWEQLLLALYRSGRQADALRAYQTARTNLADELGIEPGPALCRMEERILAQDPRLDLLPARAAVGIPSELPLQRTSFVGRERELAQGAELLAGSRLLTLTGAPGSGKTRLALRLAADCQSDFPHGVFLASLAAITNPRLLAGTIARVLGLREVQAETALDSLRAFLRGRRALLILDNFEQILPAAPQIGQLLDAAPDLTIMVTSRAPLGVSGEQEFPVPPLDLPPTGPLPDLEGLAACDAVALFVARSRGADPNFDLNAGNAAAVAEITRRLDGLPLAIELAAARIKLLTPDDLLSRLEQRLGLLVGGPADALNRHRTLRDAIAWSYDLLDQEEQALFRGLGVFVGGFTIAAAAAFADIPEPQALVGIESLLSKSLLYRPVDVGRARFAMLEMMREFAVERLNAEGEAQEVAARHARYVCHLAEEIEPQLIHDPNGAGLQRLAAEVDNLRAALRYALEAGEADLGLNLASCIWRFWQGSDQLTEGREWLESLLAQQEASLEARAKGLAAMAGLAYWQADYEEALAGYREALDLHRALGKRHDEAGTLFAMSMTASLDNDVEAGERFAEEARSIFEELGSREGLGKVISAQGYARWQRRDYDGALAHYTESLAIARECGDQSLAGTLPIGIAALIFHLGDRNEALAQILAAVDEATRSHNAHIAVWALDLTAAICASVAPEASVRLAGAVDSLRSEAGGGFLLESLHMEDARSVATPLLAPETLERAWADGRAMTLEQAVQDAKELERLTASI
jgi:predicted ATPase/DNA-binding SARP family transcriptional activator